MAAPLVLVGTPTGTPSTDISTYIDFATLTTEDTGNQADDTASFEVVDIDLTVTAMVPEGRIRVTQDSIVRFNGFISTLEPAWEGVSRRFRVNCIGISMLLDKCIIPPSDTAYVRNNSESDKARIQWLLNTFGDPFLDAGSSDFTYIQTLEPDMPRQNFANMTLRQAIERVLGAASESANYYIDSTGRLHTWDNDNPEPDVAPFEVVTTLTLAADEIAPSDLRIMWDTSELINWYFVRGRNAAGSGAYSDATSIAAHGRRQAFIDGPDSDTVKKARRLGRAALKDTKNPIVRAGFTVEADYCENGSGEIWMPGQMVTITSPAHGMTGYSIRIVRVTTTYLNGLGDRRMEIECGALRKNFLGPDQWGPGTAKYPDPSAVIQIGPPVIDLDTTIVDDFGGPPTPVGWFPLDDFDRTVYPVRSGSSASASTHTAYLPDGDPPVAGDMVWMLVLMEDRAASQDYNLDQVYSPPSHVWAEASAEGADWINLGMDVRVHLVDGTEGYTGTDDEVIFDFEVGMDTPTAVKWVTGIVRGPFVSGDVGVDWDRIDPEEHLYVSPSASVASSLLVIAMGGRAGTASTVSSTMREMPSGAFSDLGAVDPEWTTLHESPIAEDGIPPHAVVARYFDTGGSYNFSRAFNGSIPVPDAAWGYGLGVALEFEDAPAQPSAGLGSTPSRDVTGAPWPGDNPYALEGVVADRPLFVLEDGVLRMTATEPDRVLEARLTEGPWLPGLSEDWSARMRFRVNGSLVTTDAGSRYLGWTVISDEEQYRFLAHMGDTGDAAGLSVDGDGAAVHDTFTIALSTWYYMRFERVGATARARIWEDGDTEPTTWLVETGAPATVAEDDSLLLEASLGDETGTMVVELDSIEFLAEAATGQVVNSRVIDHGDGTGAFDIGEAYTPGTLIVTVDDIPVTPATQNAEVGTFTLSGSVFHDAANHPAGCAVLRVSYEKA